MLWLFFPMKTAIAAKTFLSAIFHPKPRKPIPSPNGGFSVSLDFSAFFCLGTMSQNAPETDIAPEHVHSEEEMQLEIINFGVLS